MKIQSLLTSIALASVCPLGAATIPYTNDFSGVGDNTAFPAENTDAEWTVSSGSYQWNYSSTVGGGSPSTASLPITNAGGSSFTLETQFTLSSLGNLQSTAQTLGFGLFGADSAFSGSGSSGGNAYYLADFSYANGNASSTEGLLRILRLGDSGSGFSVTTTGLADDNSGSSILAVNLDTTYTLRLETTIAGSTLNMTLSLYDATGTSQIGTSAIVSDTSPLTGENFGYRNRSALGGNSTSISFDNFEMANIPEPGTYALLIGSALGALAFVRRRRA
ncbi:PEP-CTERM sorting domain-containing protein [Cerasicoccus fimbriatus]|uniref:PEP-CTERM sorting domain-containing protein n=1 Tax=Cerasicoccus fimbriatus TaxID=3014554 RepID=UPI0022B3E4C4|nr:PEP-CTERM sorting domain-containing protein [Cerasicoccus sp. TK19100]